MKKNIPHASKKDLEPLKTSDYKVLVVEDEEAIVSALVEKFSKEGFKTMSAQNGEDGLEIALKEKPDMIIIDIIMPKMDGLSMMRKIREKKGWGTGVNIIMLTNLSDPESVSEAAKYGVFDFLVKTDWKLNDVVKLVKQKFNIE